MKEERDPLVTVVMPSYNHAKFIEEGIRSVWDQTYKSVELIVVDDGSNDDSWIIIEELALQSPIRMLIKRQENKGLCTTLNNGIKKSTGDLIALLASDDFYHPDFIHRNVMEYRKYTGEMVVLHSDAYVVDENSVQHFSLTNMQMSYKNPGSGSDIFYDMLNGNVKFISPTFVVPNYVYEKTGLYDESLMAEDFDMHLRQARVARFIYLDVPLYYKRDLKDSLGTKTNLWGDDILIALEKHKDYLGKNYIGFIKRKTYQLMINSSLQNDLVSFRKYRKKFIKSTDGSYNKIIAILKATFIIVKYSMIRIAKRILPTAIVYTIRKVKYWQLNHVRLRR